MVTPGRCEIRREAAPLYWARRLRRCSKNVAVNQLRNVRQGMAVTGWGACLPNEMRGGTLWEHRRSVHDDVMQQKLRRAALAWIAAEANGWSMHGCMRATDEV